jgi:hypothetical protein
LREFYEVKANDEAEARENWFQGELVGTDPFDMSFGEVTKVVEAFDSEDDYEAEED